MNFELEPQEAQWLINFIAQHATIAEGVNVWIKLKAQAEEQKNED